MEMRHCIQRFVSQYLGGRIWLALDIDAINAPPYMGCSSYCYLAG